VNAVLAELGCAAKPTLLVLNKADRITDPSAMHVLMRHHPKAVSVSAATGRGLGDLRDAVIEALSADFADAEITTAAANGRVLAYLAAHAEVYRQRYDGDMVVLRCYIPKHLLHHIAGPDVTMRVLGNGVQT
jgi:GTP-binding protein HflX